MVKRKRVVSRKVAKASQVTARKADEAAAEAADLPSDDEASDDAAEAADGLEDEEDDEFFETPDEKRVRLAKEYLGKLSEARAPEEVQERLDHDVEEKAQRTRTQVEDFALGEPRFHQGHSMAATCVCLSSDERTAFSGGKDCKVIRWDVETGARESFPGDRNQFECGGHFQRVCGVSLVESRGLLVSCGADRLVRLWDWRSPAKSSCVAKMLGHNGAVTAVAAESDGGTVYSASQDGSLRIWDLGSRRTVDTLLGHVAGIQTLDLHLKGRPLTGGADKTVRSWKVDQGTHLIFNKHTYSVDAVTVVDNERLVSGSQDGSLLLWSSASKKPLTRTSLGANCWIAALACVRQSNVVFSGSVDGQLRSWRFSRAGEADNSLKLAPIVEPVKAPGCINAIAVGRNLLACAVGKEHKSGRWFYDKTLSNGLLLVPLSYRAT